VEYDKYIQQVKNTILPLIRQYLNVEVGDKKLQVENIRIEEVTPSLSHTTQAFIAGRSNLAPIIVTLALYNKNNLLDRQDVRLCSIPVPDPLGIFTVNGTVYGATNIMKQLPGVYTSIRQSGITADILLDDGSFIRLLFDPDRLKFFVRYRNKDYPLYPLLRRLGVNIDSIRNAWGGEIFSQNNIMKELPKELEDLVKTKKVEPYVMKETLGVNISKLDGNILLKTSIKLLDIAKGTKEPDIRDDIRFKEVLTIVDFLADHLKPYLQRLTQRIKSRLPSARKVSDILSDNLLTPKVKSIFTTTQVAVPLTDPNILAVRSHSHTVTTLPSTELSMHAIPMAARQVHPSSLFFIDPIHTPENERVGLLLHKTLAAKIENRDIKVKVKTKSGREVWLTPKEMYNKRIFIPTEDGGFILHKGEITHGSKQQADYISVDPQFLFDESSAIPFLHTNSVNRAQMGSKMHHQALPLSHREAPLVRAALGNTTAEDTISRELKFKSPVDGVVERVIHNNRECKVVIKDNKGNKHTIEVPHNYQISKHVAILSEPLPWVKKGAKVKKGQIIFNNNFIDPISGDLALGTNLTVAYLPWKGFTQDDGIVVTESGAKKLSSIHRHTIVIEKESDLEFDYKKYKAFFPNDIPPSKINNYDEEGIIKEGSKVEEGDIIAAILRRIEAPEHKFMRHLLGKKELKPYQSEAIRWQQNVTGTVEEVNKTANRIVIRISTEEPVQVGDKVCLRHGHKGVVTLIIPDEQAPRLKDGTPVDIIVDPHSIVNRMNMGQIYEVLAGKVAKKTGKPYIVRNFHPQEIEKLLKTTKKLGIKGKEDLYDASGKKIGSAFAGPIYVMKLDFQARKQISARARDGYTADLQPTRGQGRGGIEMDPLTTYALLSHGADINLREMATIKGVQHDDYWEALMSGRALPEGKVPFAFKRFVNMLKAAGIDVRKKDTVLQLAPLTDKQIKEMSRGEITSHKIVRGKDLSPIKGGIFDIDITGGLRGEGWAHISLPEPIPNPACEDAIRVLLGLKRTQYQAIMNGELYYDTVMRQLTNQPTKTTVTQGKAIEMMLKHLPDLDVLEKKYKGSSDVMDQKRYKIVKALKKLGLTPVEAYIWHNVPVVPPVYRPLYVPEARSLLSLDFGGKLEGPKTNSLKSSTVNFMYRDLVALVNAIKSLPKEIPESEKKHLRAQLYNLVRTVSGVGSMKGRHYKGFLDIIVGEKPKEGYYQSKVLSRRQDYSGRAVARSAPYLGVDEVEIPENIAWKIFEPFIIRKLVDRGMSRAEALKHYRDRTDAAKEALESVMEDRLVLLNRAPSLHKFSIMAFKPRLTKEKTIGVNPLINKGFGLDFDGDSIYSGVLMLERPVIHDDKIICDGLDFWPT